MEAFEQLKQVGAKAPYTFCFSMEFVNQAAYDSCSGHPDHVAFVQERWLKEVEGFLELDYVVL